MSGDMSESLGLLSDAAGIIPRVLQTLFNNLDVDEVEMVVSGREGDCDATHGKDTAWKFEHPQDYGETDMDLRF